MANHCYRAAMNPVLVNTIGVAAAVLTTLCWLPQVWKIVRERDTRAISLPANFASAVGVGCWLVYGAALVDWPLIGSSAITLALTVAILALKLKHG
jgi:MtN3 and saliva related transmembrane protein